MQSVSIVVYSPPLSLGEMYLDRVLVFAREGIDGSLLQALLALRQPLVPGGEIVLEKAVRW